MLAALADHFIKIGKGKIKICFCDTEMKPEEVYFRNLSAMSGVEEIDIREGTFSEDPEMVRKIEKAIPEFEQYNKLFHHVYLPNSPIEEIESIVKRWYSQNVEEDDIAICVVDYLKESGGEVSEGNSLQEYQIIGKKASKLKDLANYFPNMIMISAVQLNEQDGVSQSARIKWFSDAVWVLQKKSEEDYGALTSKWGTHSLSPLVTRKVGRKYKDFHAVKVMEGNRESYRANYLNLNIDRFKIEERGTFDEALRDMESRGSGQLTPRVSAADARKDQWKKRP